MRIVILSLAVCLLLNGCTKPSPAERLLTESKYWDYAWTCAFSDGGSLVYGFINEEGLPVYVWAEYRWVATEKQRIFLQRSYNDPERVEIIPHSELETKVFHLFDNHTEYAWLKQVLPPLDGLRSMLRDRSAPFPIFPPRQANKRRSYNCVGFAELLRYLDIGAPKVVETQKLWNQECWSFNP